MALGSEILKILLLFLNSGGVQVLATGKSTGVEIDIKYAIIGTTLGIIISVGFLALKICMIRKHMFDNDSSGAMIRGEAFPLHRHNKLHHASAPPHPRTAPQNCDPDPSTGKARDFCLSPDTTSRRKNNIRSNLNSSDRDAQVIEL